MFICSILSGNRAEILFISELSILPGNDGIKISTNGIMTASTVDFDLADTSITSKDIQSAGVAIIKDNAVAVLAVTTRSAYQAVRPFPLRRGHAAGRAVRPVLQRR